MTDNMTAIAVVGVSRTEAREFADEKRLPEPRVYLSIRDPLDGLICASVIYSPEAWRRVPVEHMEAARRQIIKTLAPAATIGTLNGRVAQSKPEDR